MERAIIHLNIADFAAAVETNIQPGLEGYPFIIAPLGAPRAVVYDMSEEAFRQGIKKGMPLARAKRLNRKIKIMPPSFNRYEKVMKALFKETTAFTPLIESGNLDGHIYLDVTGSSRLFGPSVDVAFKLKKTFKKTFNLDPIWSLATNKLVAKVATRVVKPIGEYIVAPGDEAAFLAPLPIHLIPGLEKNDIDTLHEFNLVQVAQAKCLSIKQLEIPFSRRAPQIFDRLRGVDPEPVESYIPICSKKNAPIPISADHEFKNDTNNLEQLKKGLLQTCESIGKALRCRKLAAVAVSITLSYSDGVQHCSASKLSLPASGDMALFRQTLRMLNNAWTRRVRIRHMRLIATNFCPEFSQADLFTSPAKQAGLSRTLDRIREKFGYDSICNGLSLMPEGGQP